MSEPKYKVDSDLLTAWGEVIRVKEIDIDEEGIFYHDKWDGTWVHEKNIEHAVKIIPITDKPFCKDCKHTFEVDANSLTDEPWLTVYRDTCPKMMGLIRIGYENVFPSCYENDQPPCDCCFVPKETK